MTSSNGYVLRTGIGGHLKDYIKIEVYTDSVFILIKLLSTEI